MPYYHVYIVYVKRGKEKDVFIYNISEEDVKQTIAAPYMKNKDFLMGGAVLHPSDIDQILIFVSEKRFEELRLPNRKSPVGQPNQHVVDCFNRKVVKSVWLCTSMFITSPPAEEETTKVPLRVDKKKNVFIVHGRDDKQALLLQKHLMKKLKVDAVMFDDLPDKGKTIIEQLEYIENNVGYAFVIVTPDDVGCLTEEIEKLGRMLASHKSVKGETVAKIFGMLRTRARQNVVFELGLFIGALGRKNVCCLLKQDTEERPSDIDGILYKSFNKSVKEIFHEIADELKSD